MTILVKGVRLIGHNGSAPERSDIFIDKGIVSAIGSLTAKSADVVIDAPGQYASAGFIDIDAETDHYLGIFEHPAQDDFLRQGITTVLGGQEGASLAPLLYGELDSIEEWATTDRLNLDWHTMAEFLASLRKRPLGVNFGTLVGHSTVRRGIVGDHARPLTRNELGLFTYILRQSLQDGAFGLSTGLKGAYGRSTPLAELKSLAELVAEFKAVYATALRKAEDVREGLDEIFAIARESGAATVVSDLMPIAGQGEAYADVLHRFTSAEPSLRIYFGVSPFDDCTRPLYRFLPDWAQTGSLAVMGADLADEWRRGKIVKDLKAPDPDAFVVAAARNNDVLVGKTLRDLMELFGAKKPADALLHLMLTTKLKALVFLRNVDRDRLPDAIAHPRALIATKGASIPVDIHDRKRALRSRASRAAFPEYLRMVHEKKLLPLNDAIRKITVEPANLLGLAGRGVLAEGRIADITLMSRDFSVNTVIVNGQVALRDGEPTGTLAGSVLTRTGNA